MRKLTDDDIKRVTSLLKGWRRRPLSWDLLQQQISAAVLKGEACWSRQSLQANADINKAWLAARARLSSKSGKAAAAGCEELAEVQRLKEALESLEAKYQNLAIRHRTLVHNASMLPGGTRLLLDPLPDNTPAQKSGSGGARGKRS